MSWRLSGRIALIGCIAAVFASGCGSISQISGGADVQKKSRSSRAKKPIKKRTSRAGQVLSDPRQIGVFTGAFNTQTGQLTIQPEADGPLPTASTRATRYGPRHALTLTGAATPLAGGTLRGTVTLASTNPVELVDCRAVLLSVSNNGVLPTNADGATDLSGTPRPYWDYGTIQAGLPALTRDWEFQNPTGVNFTFRVAIFANTWTVSTADGNTLAATAFVNANTGWAVGGQGKILHTTDGGRSWTPQNAGTSADLKDVAFASATHGWAVGTGGMILVTTDGGATWRHREAIDDTVAPPRPVLNNLNALAFANAATIVAAGGGRTIVRSTDGGNTWAKVPSGTGSVELNDVKFGDGTTAWAVGASATVLKSSDSGATWAAQTIPSDQRVPPATFGNHLLGVHFTDAQNGWAVGASGWAIITTNGGATWTKKRPVGGASSTSLTGVYFANSTTGWATQSNGTLLRSTDGGNTWSVLPDVPTTQLLNGITGLPGDTNRIWVTGQNGFSGYTTDGGATWLRPGQAAGEIHAATGSGLNALHFANATLGWVVGNNGTILRTNNGGTSWRFISSLATNGTTLDDVHFVNTNDGWAVGGSGKVVRTTDGGLTWAAQFWPGLDGGGDPSYTPPNLSGVHFLDNQRGWMVGSRSTIARTLDGGNTWETVFWPEVASFNKIGWLDSQRGWIVGASGVLIGTEDGGETWNPLASGTSESLNQIAVVPAGPSGVTVWVVGARGVALKSTDGINFEPVFLDLSGESLHGVGFLPNGQHGWIVGDNGLVLRTKDSGATWSRLDAGVGDNLPLRSVFPITADESWIAGQSGTLRVFR